MLEAEIRMAMSPLERGAAVAGIIGAVAGVLALWPIVFPPAPPPAPPAPPPQIPSYSTGWIEGEGKSTKDYCDPRKVALEKEHPNFRIEMTYFPEQHKDNRDFAGIKHDQYMYQCSFSAHPK